MGRVFSYGDITHARVPGQQDFETAQSIFTERMEAGISEGIVDGAFVFGSAAAETTNRRSDFDVFIALEKGNVKSLEFASLAISAISNTTHRRIETGAIILAKNDLVHGRHEIDRFFGNHLAYGRRILLGNDPAQYMAHAPEGPGEILAGYLANKKRRLIDANVSTEKPIQRRGIQRMLELPAAVGRKSLQALAEVDYLKTEADSADKQALLGEARRLMQAEGLDEGFDYLHKLDQRYSNTLEGAYDHSVSEKNYNDMLATLRKNLTGSVTWVRDVEKALLPKFDL